MNRPHADTARQLTQWETLYRAVTGSHERVLERVEDAGVPRQWFAVVHQLYRVPGHRLPMSRLARDLVMTSGGFTKLADRMGREGLIDRRGSEGDRRVVFATLTEAGLALAERAELAYLDAVREVVLEVLSPALLEQIAADLGPLALAAVTAVEAVPPIAVAEQAAVNIADPAPASQTAGAAADGSDGTGWDESQPERRRRAFTAEPDQSPRASHSSPM